ncbi:bifunctional phosphoribosylaminoimidazolecarboxamide formyltransferase/IMP cyclohydrolase [Rubrobacter marinus]|uniref:Bifunctional purine biosynthesis protein PurH n=1 Tax=Rubrobacter marinus TaxID=2653852 RepID=A0A6G8PWT9_9ACTN|nr:bifunctional phosphoribosylaminoimidazolecarboxamide formyltransferase/IMP cyclohydrolase [Rubrobacter marinus]QIN78658.1 bifunctional phosphoribosylaminoimidazolecarboxamide formyltransferase/IMP cyclohydrolase [Rubrobacter marinus]
MRRRALVSVSDKRGVAAFARRLHKLGFEIISTGGTARALEEAKVPVTQVAEVTGAPEMLAGRVKTLHPRIHGGILADLEDPEQVVELVDHDIGPIDLVCVNLYPFEETVAGGAEEKEAIEQIDIGGPTLLRAAAKNFKSVTVVPSPSFYKEVAAEMELGQVEETTRRRLALEAFRRTAEYDASISAWLAERVEMEAVPSTNGTAAAPEQSLDDAAAGDDVFPETLTKSYEKVLPLRYGENPHQAAAYYAEAGGGSHLLTGVERLQGRPLSFNNLYDVDAARTLLADLSEDGRAAAVIIKHANPCGAAVADDLAEAYGKALASDPTSAFGGIVALGGPVDGELAREISKVFTEVLISPSFSEEARKVFSEKPNMTLLQAGPIERPELSAKPVAGGLLVQETDRVEGDDEYELVTSVHPSPEGLGDLLFAWKVAKNVKSNAIVLVRDGATVGIGAGQTSRVDSSELAVRKAGERAKGAVAASDAFFPFADGVEALAKAGVGAVIQPGGSKRDAEVVEAADRRGLSMVLTKRRHFLH